MSLPDVGLDVTLLSVDGLYTLPHHSQVCPTTDPYHIPLLPDSAIAGVPPVSH